MKSVALAALFLLATNCAAQAGDAKHIPVVEKFCGRLIRAEEGTDTPSKKQVLVGNNIRLYRADDSGQCCAGLSLVAQATTSRKGSFHLQPKKLASGLYWVAVEMQGQEYKLLVRYRTPEEADELCNRRNWSIDNEGMFAVSQFIRVD